MTTAGASGVTAPPSGSVIAHVGAASVSPTSASDVALASRYTCWKPAPVHSEPPSPSPSDTMSETSGAALHTASTVIVSASVEQPSDATTVKVLVPSTVGTKVGDSTAVLLSAAASASPTTAASKPPPALSTPSKPSALHAHVSGSSSVVMTSTSTDANESPSHTDCSAVSSVSKRGATLHDTVTSTPTGSLHVQPSVAVTSKEYVPSLAGVQVGASAVASSSAGSPPSAPVTAASSPAAASPSTAAWPVNDHAYASSGMSSGSRSVDSSADSVTSAKPATEPPHALEVPELPAPAVGRALHTVSTTTEPERTEQPSSTSTSKDQAPSDVGENTGVSSAASSSCAASAGAPATAAFT
mmetsp:Transcript_24915/g.86766  ORF Transcript_24915/g.86766 Transcript_24915/m.86766 type:complete len:357 (+) Transcript_24915:8268-9338(+)